jgi:hypothetical protein
MSVCNCLLSQKLSVHSLQATNEVPLVLPISLFYIVHDIKHLVYVEVVVNHQREKLSDSVVHSFIRLFEFIPTFQEFFSVVLGFGGLLHL